MDILHIYIFIAFAFNESHFRCSDQQKYTKTLINWTADKWK